MYEFQLWLVVILITSVGRVSCHGRLWEPPSRSTMWRFGYNTSVNINDNELNCGGFKNQWIYYGGLCGVCGDPYQQKPRENEAGGKYASGIITRLYRTGDTVSATVDLTANHGGYFEFRVCPIQRRGMRATHECFNQHPLLIMNQQGGFKYIIEDRGIQGYINVTLKLPQNLSCKHCVLQWRYWTGSRWGCDGDRCGKGLGPQEEFYGCSDIAIAPPGDYIAYLPLITKPTETKVDGYDLVGEPKAVHKYHHMSHNDERRLNVYLSEFAGTAQSPAEPHIVSPQILQPQYAIPQTKVLFKYRKRIQPNTRPNIKKHLSEAVQKILVETILNYYKKDERKMMNPEYHCFPTSRFSANPIIVEWCHRGCPGLNRDCPPNMCFCKAKHSQEILIPFVDLSHYKSELINKVPFELTNTFSDSKLYDRTFAPFIKEEHVMRNYAHENRKFSNKPVIDIASIRYKNGKIDSWTGWKGAQLGTDRERLVHTPIMTQSRPRFYTIPMRAYVKTSRIQSPDYLGSRPHFDLKRKVSTRLPLKVSRKFFTKPPVVDGLTFFSHSNPDISNEPRFLSHETAQTKADPPSLSLRYKEPNLIPIRLNADKNFNVNERHARPRNIRCTASTIFSQVSNMIQWCQKNCSFGFCPPSVCKCF